MWLGPSEPVADGPTVAWVEIAPPDRHEHRVTVRWCRAMDAVEEPVTYDLLALPELGPDYDLEPWDPGFDSDVADGITRHQTLTAALDTLTAVDPKVPQRLVNLSVIHDEYGDWVRAGRPASNAR
ncbi:hypothetical protein DSM112329_02879 [Paraconexibacter sp. AEG42_29]|uniref:Uncharacterized protein n=1 Tax=Paraconexibacter sp. AEG42_29 TaxID=2997339 RepID=A0AAU7AWF4_9ACTN